MVAVAAAVTAPAKEERVAAAVEEEAVRAAVAMEAVALVQPQGR